MFINRNVVLNIRNDNIINKNNIFFIDFIYDFIKKIIID